MRRLTADEAQILRECIPGAPGSEVDAGDEPRHDALVARGLLLVREDDEWVYWDTTPLGRLALRCFDATTSAAA